MSWFGRVKQFFSGPQNGQPHVLSVGHGGAVIPDESRANLFHSELVSGRSSSGLVTADRVQAPPENDRGPLIAHKLIDTTPPVKADLGCSSDPDSSPVALPPCAPSHKNHATLKEVYFDFDKSTLDAKEEKIIDEDARVIKEAIAERTRNGQKPQHVVIVGHTDTMGSDSYNQALSERRALAIRNALVRDGVAPELIETRGVGKKDQEVSTKDQVEKRENRRAQLLFKP